MKGRLLYPLLITAAGLAAYANSFSCPFIFDDYVQILQNLRLQQGLFHLLGGTTRPVVALTLALNYRLGGLDVWGYHAVNMGIHMTAGLLLYGIVRRTLQSPPLRRRYGKRAAGLAAAVSLLWVVHPLQTQSVTYVIQRAESLMGLFYLLALYSVIRSNQPGGSRPWPAAAVLACTLGMATKAVMATAPVVILLYDRIFLCPSLRGIRLRRGALYLALFSTTGGVLLLLFGGRPEVYGPEVGFAVKGVPPAAYALTQPGVILHYLRLSVWPHPLVLDYGWPLARTAWEIIPPMAAMAGLAAATLWALRRQPAAGFLGAWFFLILAPTSSFIPVLDPAFEHRMYLPLAAVIAGIVLGADHLLPRLSANPRARLLAGAALAAAAALGFGAATARRNHDYRTVLSIWEDTVRKRPLNSRAHSNHGAALHLQGRLEEAIAEYREALRLEPDYADGHNTLGYVLEAQGRREEAKAAFEEALRLLPRHERAKKGLALVLRNQGLIFQAEGKGEEALERYRRAVELNPEDAGTHNNVGTLLFQKQRWQEAEEWFRRAIRLDPRHAEAHNNLGAALEMQGRVEEAIPHYRRALELKPDYASAHVNLERSLSVLEGGRGQAAARP